MITCNFLGHAQRQNVGTFLGFGGSFCSIAGSVLNSLGNYKLSYGIWILSNLILIGWCCGLFQGWWNNRIGSLAVLGMYGIMLITAIVGWWRT